MSLPTGPAAPAAAISGPVGPAWLADLWVFHFNDHARAWIEEDDKAQRESGAGGAPPALMGGSYPIAGMIPILGLAVSVPSDTSLVPADVGAAAASISGLSMLPTLDRALLKSFCFAEGTRVLMADGSTMRIEDLQEGDVVLADDPQDARGAEPRKVTQVHRTATYRLFHIEIGRADGGEIVATGSHPFWTQRGWITAEELTNNDVLTDDLERAVAIRAIAIESRDAPTFNLSVEGSHTFFVVAGKTPVLVHNVDPWDVAFSRQVGPNEVFQSGPWKNLRVAEAIEEATSLGKLPPGLSFNAARYVTPAGEEVIAAINNRTLYVAQEAGLLHINPVNNIDSAKAYADLGKQLAFDAQHGGAGQVFFRCP
jgi:hypothetical protein